MPVKCKCQQCEKEFSVKSHRIKKGGVKYCSRECMGKSRRGNVENFLKKAKEKYGDKYDYSKFDYITIGTKGIIICPEHGEFEATPASHLSSTFGCSDCGYKHQTLSKEEFIKRANKIHNKYDYSKFDYVTLQIKGIIICPSHGEFSITPYQHLYNVFGCKSCVSEKKLNEMIKKAQIRHNKKYDYSKVVMNKSEDVVTIICPEHGEFKYIWYSHISGGVCPKCSLKKRISKKEFIQEIKEIHNKYDYSKVVFLNDDKIIQSTVITIICPKHGEFQQVASTHKAGGGCGKCALETRGSKEKFIKLAEKKHGDKYYYSKFDYINWKTLGIIICPLHGEFLKNPSNFLDKKKLRGCSICGKIKGQLGLKKRFDKPAILYFIEFTNHKNGNIFFKIGYTTQTIKKRFAQLPEYMTYKVLLEEEGTIIEIVSKEHYILEKLSKYSYYAKILTESVQGASECFKGIDVGHVKNILKNDYIENLHIEIVKDIVFHRKKKKITN